MKKTILVILFLTMTTGFSSKQAFPVVISGCNHSIALPFGKPFRMDPLYPGASAGTEYVYSKGNWGQIHQTGNLGFFANSIVGTGIFSCSLTLVTDIQRRSGCSARHRRALVTCTSFVPARRSNWMRTASTWKLQIMVGQVLPSGSVPSWDSTWARFST